MSPRRTALVGAVALLVLGELVARLQGDRLCSDRPGVVYERSVEVGWRHVPGLSGWLGTCDGDGVPPTPIETDADGLVGPARPRSKPPGTVRVLLLGGNVPEGFGVPQDLTIARLLELYADERRGARLEVLNAATGGWALDNSLAFFRSQGAARAPDLVVLVIDPVADLASLSPAHLAALGRRVPAKPYFSLRRRAPGPDAAVRARPDTAGVRAVGSVDVVGALPAAVPRSGTAGASRWRGPRRARFPTPRRTRNASTTSTSRGRSLRRCVTRSRPRADVWSPWSPHCRARPGRMPRARWSASGSSPSPTSSASRSSISRPASRPSSVRATGCTCRTRCGSAARDTRWQRDTSGASSSTTISCRRASCRLAWPDPVTRFPTSPRCRARSATRCGPRVTI